MPDLHVVRAGAQTTVQDLGRPGQAHLGVPPSGALDRPALATANRLVGNEPAAAGLECLLGNTTLALDAARTIALTGGLAEVRVEGRAVAWGSAVSVPAGAEIALGPVTVGLRAYVAVAGGIDVPPVLGSRASDLLSGIGRGPLSDGDTLPLGVPSGWPREGEVAPPRPDAVTLRLRLGPREDWFEPASLAALDGATYAVGAASNRVGLRLEGEPLVRRTDRELASEGMVLGAVQVPPDGQPVVFLHDHPTTGGYPVVGVVLAEDLPLCAQLRPGEVVGLSVVDGASR